MVTRKQMVAEVVDLAEIVQQALGLLVDLVVMVVYLLAAVVGALMRMARQVLLAVGAAMAAMVWFVFFLGNQL
jgi:hypothetical protein